MDVITSWEYRKKRHSPVRKDIKYLKKLYKINNKSDEFIIDLVINEYKQIFNPYDNRPYNKKKLNNEVKDFLEQGFRDIPNLFKIEIRITVLENKRNKEMEEKIENAIRNTYNFDSKYLLRKVNSMRTKVVTYGFIAILLLAVGYVVEENSINRVLIESVDIGGWVFLWEAIHIFFIDRHLLLYELNSKMRTADSEITFKYVK